MLTKRQHSKIGLEFPHKFGGNLKITGVSLSNCGKEFRKNKNGVTYFDVECTQCNEVSSKLFQCIKVGQTSCNCNPKMKPEKVEDIIGKVYTTKTGSHLTVVRFYSRLPKGDAVFEISCSVCSEDTELFPSGSLLVTKSSLTRGQAPCGCGRSVQWSSDQYIIRVQRECTQRGYEFLGLLGEFKGCKTFLDLYNPKTENRWQTTRIYSFLDGHGDPKAVTENLGMYGFYSHRIHEKDFLYVIDFDGEYLKVGRSFHPERRIQELVRESGVINLDFIHIIEGVHGKIYKLEQKIHNILYRENLNHRQSTWSSETFHNQSLPTVSKLLKVFKQEKEYV